MVYDSIRLLFLKILQHVMTEEGNPACSFRVKREEEKSPPESSLIGIDFKRISCQYYVAIKENFVR